ncbi:MAG: lysophospholipid acyltransferase family protein [Phycisphaerales bacterium JB059]
MDPLATYRARHPGTGLIQLLFYEFMRLVCTVLLMVCWRFRVYGRGRVPGSGALLVVANHQSYLDSPAIGVGVGPRHTDSVAREGLFRVKLLAPLIRRLYAFPVREDGGGDTRAIKETLSRLERGRAVIIFPEGSRTFDGEVAPFKRGAAVIVKRSRCPVLPVAIEGAYDAWPRGRRLPKVFGQRVGVAIGEPIGHEELMRNGADAALDRLRDEVEALRLELRARLRGERGAG